MHNITPHFTVRPLLHLSAQIRRLPIISYAYESQRSLQNTPPVDWWGISKFGLNQCKLLRRRQQSGRYSAPEPPTTAALPQNVPLSPLMRLVAPRVAAAALDGGRPWWMRRGRSHRCRCFVWRNRAINFKVTRSLIFSINLKRTKTR